MTVQRRVFKYALAMNAQPIRTSGDAVLVDVHVVPNASRSHIVGRHGDRVKVRISAAPEMGRANKELLAVLIDATGAKRARIVSGETSRRKTVELVGVSSAAVRTSLIDDM